MGDHFSEVMDILCVCEATHIRAPSLAHRTRLENLCPNSSHVRQVDTPLLPGLCEGQVRAMRKKGNEKRKQQQEKALKTLTKVTCFYVGLQTENEKITQRAAFSTRPPCSASQLWFLGLDAKELLPFVCHLRLARDVCNAKFEYSEMLPHIAGPF